MPYRDPEKKRQWEQIHRQGGKRKRSRKSGSGNGARAVGSTSGASFARTSARSEGQAGPQTLGVQDSAITGDKQDKPGEKFKLFLGWCALGIFIFLGFAASGQNFQPRVGQ